MTVACFDFVTGDGKERSVQVIMYFGFQQCAETNVSNSKKEWKVTTVLCKGADNVIYKWLKADISDMKVKTQEHLNVSKLYWSFTIFISEYVTFQ